MNAKNDRKDINAAASPACDRFASDKKAGEFYTPYQVCKSLAKLAAHEPERQICDPACGSGGLIVAAKELSSLRRKICSKA